jgi:hypothetical protein
MKKYAKHFEKTILVNAKPDVVFSFADDHKNLSSHMNQSSLMLGGSGMKTETDEKKGLKVGSHIKLSGKVFGINLFLDEVITVHKPPYHKKWQTIGKVNLLVIGHYALGFKISPLDKEKSILKVFIDYDLPQSQRTRWLGIFLGRIYAQWCVNQIINSVKKHFKK